MPGLAHQICFNHTGREAVARCPECAHFYCRECITDHDDRVLCASCLRKLTYTSGERRNRFSPVAQMGAGAFGLFTATLFFYTIGRLLLLIPTQFHDGTIWQAFDAWNP